MVNGVLMGTAHANAECKKYTDEDMIVTEFKFHTTLTGTSKVNKSIYLILKFK